MKLNTSQKMKNFNNTSLFNFIKSKGLILISSSFLLTSCVIYTGGYSETDGVYYDPNKDSLPAGSYAGSYGNQVDDYYNYQDTYPSIYDNNQQNLQDQQNRYNVGSNSDWGTFTGSETNYTNFNNWGWGGMGFGYGGFGGWGYPNYGWGWNGGFNSFGWGMGFGWGNSLYSPWGWGGGFYDPFWSYGYGGWGGYYGGYNSWYNGGYYRPAYIRSGSNGRLGGMISDNRTNGFRGINSVRTPQRIAGNGMRNDVGNIRNSNGIRNSNMGNIRTQNNNGNIRQFPNNGNIRNSYPNNNGNVRSTPNYPSNGSVRSQNNGGFRNDSYNAPIRSGGNSGGFNSGGGMRSGGSSGGGGMRSGGGGRR